MDLFTLLLSAWCLSVLAEGPRLPPLSARAAALTAVLWPELEVLARLWGPEALARWRLGPTHALVMLPVAAVLAAACARLVARWRGNPCALLPAALLGMGVMVTHLALDLLGHHKVKLAWPVRDTGWCLDWLYAPDPVLWAALAAGLWLRAWRVPPQRACAAALLVSGIYVGLMGGAHNAMSKRAAGWARLQGMEAEEVVALPLAPGGYLWMTLAFNEEEILMRVARVMGSTRPALRFPTGLEQPLVEDFLASPTGKLWRGLARVPVAQSLRLADGTYEVFLRDVAHAGWSPGAPQARPHDLRALFDDEGTLHSVLWMVPVPWGDPARPLVAPAGLP